jgi:hydroxymethylpyrimidine/phosphomethylpyrimidine kinase
MNTIPDSPIVLTIAGFDPSGCAGVLADAKTFEANGVHGMAVCTANTEQNVGSFKKANWIKREEILSQLNLLQQEVNFEFVKIGLVESFELLNSLVDELISKNPSVKIIWDPVCKASAQFIFHTEIEKKLLEAVCAKLYLITPNLEEQAVLAPGMETEEAGRYLARFCNVLIKGGHSTTESSTDSLFTKAGVYYLEAEKLHHFSKRGTGCVLSSAIVANLAKGENLLQSCVNAKRYINHYLTSNHSLVGMHSYENQ